MRRFSREAALDGRNNLQRIAQARGVSQRQIADALQLAGLDADTNAVRRLVCGKRFVTDTGPSAMPAIFSRLAACFYRGMKPRRAYGGSKRIGKERAAGNVPAARSF